MLLTALLIPPVLARIGAEEALLRSQFGDEYGEYCARTSRLIPGFYQSRKPTRAEYSVTTARL